MNHLLSQQPIKTDSSNWFASNTMTERFPNIVDAVVRANPAFPSRIKRRLQELSRGMQENSRIPPLTDPAFDKDQWDLLWRPFRGQRWQETQWFFAETWAYRLLLEACDYFSTLKDPFAPLKEEELQRGDAFWPILAAAEARTTGGAPGTTGDELLQALYLSLWGNRADLSFSGGAALDAAGAGQGHLVLREEQRALEHLLSLKGTPGEQATPGREVHLVMDNTGSELAGDMVLCLALQRLLGVSLVLHLKLYPTYVSDTTVADLARFLEVAALHPRQEVRTCAAAFASALEEGTLRLAPDDFWCQPRFLDDAPPRIGEALEGAGLVIFKGDLNYRRVFHDTLWSPETPLEEAAGRKPGTPWLFLRTIKSDCLAGVSRERCQILQEEDPRWRTSGAWGLLQVF
ncbi:hypothetical protein AU468_02345 [Alkalispirochaeta sphaeroplastigenens]|uniref:Damage-control phosphatase ARMT1-like metal-binding domain-containing protein n=1 Tax=Alkalispirochaeta sphaeroplastigenens TaxID=1187066 RepID=A0A2S4JZ11_9SPIO|nr:ARMT1-like domain-containing protein [Alkalispirochaeta sphaeroplastigenens]POR04758.1 hypothetical protein AU468_02345 [Alkalispirochaeta sphaeroplastigenens]